MRRITIALSLVSLLVGASVALAEGVEKRTHLPANATRIRGASTVLPVPWGLVALGGSRLRHLPAGTRQWALLHRVPGDNLYRIAGDESGRLLASWEKEPHLHLFSTRTKEHLTLPKPAKPSPEFKSFSLDDIFFAKDGEHAIVYMHGQTGGVEWTTVAYRVPLDGTSEPAILFQQAGYGIHQNDRVAVFVIPEDPRRSCDHGGCSVAEIAAWEIAGRTASRRTLLRGDGERHTSARLVWGSDDENVAALVTESPNKRHLLRWRVGEDGAEYKPFPGASHWRTETRLLRSGEIVDLTRLDGEGGLEIKRSRPDGWAKRTTLPPLPAGDPDVAPDSTIHSIRERQNGDLVVHWGNHLVLLSGGKPARILNIEPMLKRRNEWAGVAIYVVDPEALWIGIEVGAGRDFVYVPFADIDERAKPIATGGREPPKSAKGKSP